MMDSMRLIPYCDGAEFGKLFGDVLSGDVVGEGPDVDPVLDRERHLLHEILRVEVPKK